MVNKKTGMSGKKTHKASVQNVAPAAKEGLKATGSHGPRVTKSHVHNKVTGRKAAHPKKA